MMLRTQSPNTWRAEGSFPHVLKKLVLLDQLERLSVEAARGASGGAFFGSVLARLNISINCCEADLARIPSRGPAILVANHPFGLIEGPVMGAILAGIRQDFKFLGNSLLCQFKELREHVIPVDIFESTRARKTNWRALREAITWVRGGGVLVIFPAGEVASVQVAELQITDPAWNPNIARLVRLTGAPVISVYIHGTNGPGFHVAGLLHPRFRTALLPRELLNKKGSTIRLSIGTAISAGRLAQVGPDSAAIEYLRRRTLLLRERSTAIPSACELTLAPVDVAIEPAALRAEIDALVPCQTLLAHEDLMVFVATSPQIPNILREIGRLREISFRQAGEGTGGSLDLDEFDSCYRHLFIWNRARSEIAGAYRLAGTDEVVSRGGNSGLYSSTLFRFGRDFLRRIHPALELGRSFVRPEYQKSYLPLLLLWRGIGHYVARHPRYRILFGPVSISARYTTMSRSLIVSYLEAKCVNRTLASCVQPRCKFRSSPLFDSQARMLASLLPNIDALSEAVMDLEPDQKGVPVLVRQYLHVGGQMLAFSVDDAFSGVLDGLVVVDLGKVNPRLLEKYMSKVGAEIFQAYHRDVNTLAHLTTALRSAGDPVHRATTGSRRFWDARRPGGTPISGPLPVVGQK